MMRFFYQPASKVVLNTGAVLATTAIANGTYHVGASVYNKFLRPKENSSKPLSETKQDDLRAGPNSAISP